MERQAKTVTRNDHRYGQGRRHEDKNKTNLGRKYLRPQQNLI